jgi:hypothetical protein
MEVKTRFEILHMAVPVLLADAFCLLFSDHAWERRFMDRMWEQLKIYSMESVELHSIANYPRNYSKDGPVPILISCEELKQIANGTFYGRRNGVDFLWTNDQYRYTILGMRAVSIP